MFCLLYNPSSSISFSANLGGLQLFKIQNSLHEYFSPSIIPVSGWSLLSSLCTTLKASRNSVKSILPSLLKSILRARSSMALLSMSTPRWALKRRQVWRNSSMEIRPENDKSTHPHYWTVRNIFLDYCDTHYLPEWSLSIMLNIISMSVLYLNRVSAKFWVT